MRSSSITVGKIVMRGVLAAAAAQGALIGGLVVADLVRKRRNRTDTSFPHEQYEPVALEFSEESLRPFTYGAELYDDMLAEIERAEHTILLETFIWKGDELGQQFVAALDRKARAGVRVYVIFDWFANLVVSRSFKRFPSTINTLEFRPVAVLPDLVDPRSYTRDHRKLLVVDGRVAFIGGFNIGSLYAHRWRDTQLRIEGPEVSEIERSFAVVWNENRTTDLPLLPQGRLSDWNPTVKLHRNDPYLRIFPIRGLYLEAFERAQHHIYLTHAYFIPDRALRSMLAAAARRGVDVQIVLPWHSNHVVADWLGRRFFGELLRAGVRIFAYEGAMIHAKTATADGEWSTVGTTNMDRVSLLGNYEVNVAVHSERFAATMERVFELDKTNTFEITLDWWNRRPWPAKLIERGLEHLAPLL